MNIKELSLAVFFSLLVITSFSQKEYTVNGYVKDFKTQEAIPGAAVFEYNTVTNGTPTDTEGYFSLDFSKNDVYIKFAYIGFKDTVINLFLFKDTTLTVFLKSDTEIEEVVKEDDEIHWHLEIDTLSGAEKEIVAELVEDKNAIKSTGYVIPKVKLKNEIQELDVLFLRKGKGSNQNLIFIDGARLYKGNRSFDLIPIITDEAIQSLKYYYGKFPAKYGSHISPVLDIKMKEGDMLSYKGTGSISLFNASIYVEGPVIKDKSSFFVSAGKTFFNNPYTDLFRKESENKYWVKPSSFDLNLKYTHQFSENDKVSTSFYTLSEANKYENNETYIDSIEYNLNRKYSEKTTNTLMSARWEHIFSPDFTSQASLTFSRYNLNYNFEGDSTGLMLNERSWINTYTADYKTGNEDITFNLNFNYSPDIDHFISFGGNAINHHFRPIDAELTIHDFEHPLDIDTLWDAETYNAQEFIVYAQDIYKITEKLTVEGGIHFSTFKISNKTYFSVQPRIYGNYKLFKHLSLNASYSNYKQYIHFLANREIGLSTDIFIASDENILPQFTHNFSAGIEIELPFKITLTGNAFYENSINVTEYKDKYNFFNNDDSFKFAGTDLKDRIEQANENKYGIRILLHKDYDKFSFNISHYMTVSERKFENLNFPENFPYRHNNLQDFKLEVSYKINEELTAGLNWMYYSGNFVSLNKQSYIPYNYETGNLSSSVIENSISSIEGNLLETPTNINSYKLPSYQRTDLYLCYKLDNHSFDLHIYNIFNRKNPDYVDFQRPIMSNSTNYQLVNYTILPIFPVLTYTYRFE